jgi:hypothetical protein
MSTFCKPRARFFRMNLISWFSLYLKGGDGLDPSGRNRLSMR